MRTHPLLVLTLTFGARGTGAAKDEPAPRVREVPSASELAAPPRICVAPDSRVYVALPVRRGSTSPRRAGRRPRSTSRSTRGPQRPARRRAPRPADRAAGKSVVLAAISRHTKDGGGDLLAWRSTDAGATWSDAVRVSDVPAARRRGSSISRRSATGGSWRSGSTCERRVRACVPTSRRTGRRGARTPWRTSLPAARSASAAIRRSRRPVRAVRSSRSATP